MEDTAKMRSFIEVYKSLPVLWDCKHENYKNKSIRNKSYYKLLREYKKIRSDSTLDDLKKKISNMRTCYRRELKKVIKSQQSGAGANDIYVSSLWYYDDLNFLPDVEMSLHGRSTLSSDEDENDSINVEQKQVSKKTSFANSRVDFVKKTTERLEPSPKMSRVEDEAAVYADGWACMYRQINPNQQLFAKRAIDEILFLGRLNELSLKTVQSISNGPHISTSTISEASTPYPTSLAPVVYNSDDSVEFVPKTVSSRNTQSYKRTSTKQTEQTF